MRSSKFYYKIELRIQKQQKISRRMMYIDVWLILNFPSNSKLRRREDIPNLENVGKSEKTLHKILIALNSK